MDEVIERMADYLQRIMPANARWFGGEGSPQRAAFLADLRAAYWETLKQAAESERTGICYRCQMRLPLRVLRVTIGPRGGVDDVCAACNQPPVLNGDALRAEVVALRKAKMNKVR